MFQWTHSDPRGIETAAAEAMARCAVSGWGIDAIGVSNGTRAEDFLALIVESILIRQELIDAGNSSLLSLLAPVGNKIGVTVLEGSAPDINHVNAQIILLRTWEVFARSEGWNDTTATQLTATSGKPVTEQTTAMAPVAIVAIVIGIVVLAGLVAFVVWNVNTVVDRQLARKAQAQELMRAHAECQKMLSDHAAAEKAAGKAIDFNRVELATMARLARLQENAMHGFSATLDKPLIPLNLGKPPGDTLDDVLTLAVVLGFVYFLIRREI